jgi:hydrogenase expression/formation protein HypE
VEIGKLPNDVLEKIVFANIKNKRKEVLVRAAIGEDNAIIDFGKEVCVMSTDPITGATKDVGKLAIHISCNDVASSGAEPIAVLMTIMAPPTATEIDIENIMREAGQAAKELNVEIVGGHTEITDAVNRVVISTTVIGKQLKERLPDYKEIEVGDKVLITKYAGIEGTSIIAKELENTLIDKIGKEKVEEAKAMDNMISVVKDGVLCGKIGVNYMHDITEGGILGAVWEASKATNKGIKIYEDLIPIKEVTKEISEILNIDPYRLISSGSMLIIGKENKVESLQDMLGIEGIKVTVIGEIIEDGIILETKNKDIKVEPPTSDELYKALSFNE